MTIETQVDQEDGILQITIARADKKNAITFEMYEKMIEALHTAADRSDIFVVVITGEQGVFTAGNDLANFAEWPDDDRATAAWRFLSALSTHPKPTLAAVDGLAIGVGTTMLLHCDLAFAAPNARFQLPFVNLGLVPEAASSLLLLLIAGRKATSKLLFSGEAFGAEEALSLGILSGIWSHEDLLPNVLAMARQIAEKPAAAVQATKRLMVAGLSEAVARQMKLEIEAFDRSLTSPEFAEAFTAFRERRKPDFKQINKRAASTNRRI